jgi:hypothetical protein
MDDPEREELEAEFTERIYQVYRDAAKLNYHATAFATMLQQIGGVATARHCLLADTSGFTRLWELRALHLSVEFVVLQPAWRSLFTELELETARGRLAAHGAPELVAKAEAS